MTPTERTGDARGFDFIVVGSGAGGGPLAARLAIAGFRVLVVEAGPNHADTPGAAHETSLVPSFHGLATEDDALRWEFFVKHYDHPPTGEDPKRNPKPNQTEPDPTRHGIFYPRASGLGGCTVHNAMITIAGPDQDWEDLADFVGDDSWRGGAMRAYFQRLERNEYRSRPTPAPTSLLGRAWDLIRWMAGFDPDHTKGRHGFRGWLHTSVTDIALGLSDWQLIRMLIAALKQSRRTGIEPLLSLVFRFLRGVVSQGLDPNDSNTQASSPEGLAFVPLSVCGKRTTIHQSSETPFVMRGRRSSPREFLLQTLATHPENLEIRTNTFVTSVIFADGTKPRAVGVRVLKGERLYRAHRTPGPQPGEPDKIYVRDGGEVILCGGAFNTPQLLMLSGIGDVTHLNEIAPGLDHCVLRDKNDQPLPGEGGKPRRIDLPGVGRNLQDRYEVTVISKMKRDFRLLDGATFRHPGNSPADPHLARWRAEGTGLYTSNGSVLGILKRSRPELPQPDLFIFGIPLPFRGYELDYSKVGDQHRCFTWAVLKGHTRNNDGIVTLRTTNPLDKPEINFHYFNEASCAGDGHDDELTFKDKCASDPDLLALVEGVKFVRGIADRAGRWVVDEDYPGTQEVPRDDDAATADWIRRVAWGHHACGTCRMGPAYDENAVLDSRFRVRGVDKLRVVDASIFPKIPGYFIVTNIYMASEKAADVLAEDHIHRSADAATYPRALRKLEEDALVKRRNATTADPENPGGPRLPAPKWSGDAGDDVTGLALSGGGIRSATLNLGILQALAQSHWLRRIDFLSTVSGGSYIGSFLGRWFDQLREEMKWGGERQPPQPVPDRIERELNDATSPAIRWLRRHGNYIAPSGEGDERVNAAVFIRNFVSVHFVVGLLVFAAFGLANGIRYGVLDPAKASLDVGLMSNPNLPLGTLLGPALGAFYSVWFIVFELVLLFVVLPRIVGYWIVSEERHERYQKTGLLLVFVTSATLLFLSVRDGLNLALLLLALAPLTAFVHVELAWRRGRAREAAIGSGGVETQRLRTRNLLTYDLGVALAMAGAALVFAIVDTFAHGLHQSLIGTPEYLTAFAAFAAGLSAVAPVARFVANLFAAERKAGPSSLPRSTREQVTAGLLAVILFTLPLLFYSFASHAAYQGGAALQMGLGAALFALLLSLILTHPQALTFVNRSSLAQTYAARLARAYLGASNPLRHRPEGANVTEVVAGDDVPSMRNYKPYNVGGPLHLINVTVNQTIDFTSQRGNRDRKGENLAVSGIGMSIGRTAHSAWADPVVGLDERGARRRDVRLEPLGHMRGNDHPLIDETGAPANRAEMLSLRTWMGISGAAVAPGRGQTTRLGTALLYGLANLRLGYWWDSGISEVARDGYPKLTFFRRIFYVAQRFFLTQALLIAEWTARYPGPWERFWYISDGGFFENLGGYELIRRRVPRIILCDGSADPTYQFEDFANLVRKARIDFDAEITPFDLRTAEEAGIPADVAAHLGTLDDLRPVMDEDGKIIGPSGKHAALFWVQYRTGPRRASLLLYFKSSVTGDETADIEQYHRARPEFPHERTSDQFFDEAQWESYRGLGKHIAAPVVRDLAWFWSIPLRTGQA